MWLGFTDGFEERQGSFDCSAARFARVSFAQDDRGVAMLFGQKKAGTKISPG